MNVAVIGSGLSALSTAFYLLDYADVRITLYEQAPVVGGRANVTEDGEHCARIFLDDYYYLLGILDAITRADGRTVRETLHRPLRYCHTSSGWVEISHLYPILAKELRLRDKVAITMARRRSPLLAEQNIGPNTNRYGSLRNFSAPGLMRMSTSLLRTRIAYILEGPTDEYLLAPWVAHLQDRGVTIRTNAEVSRIRDEADGAALLSGGDWRSVDAVVVTAYVSDATRLLEASGIGHRVKTVEHSHCKCFTVMLDPRESVVTRGEYAIYSHRGLTVILQPAHSRCVVLCTRKCRSTDTGYVMSQLRSYLDLDHEIVSVKARDNHRPNEAIFTAEYMDPDRMLPSPPSSVFFAGSYLRNGYAVDSGEGAARSGFQAVQRLTAAHGLRRP